MMIQTSGKWVFGCLLGVVLLLAGCSNSANLVDQDGKSLELDQFAGDWIAINYWAVWCAPCIKEIPELNQLDKADNGIRVLGVDYDGALPEELKANMKKLNIQFRVFRGDPSEALGFTPPDVLPATYILNAEGQLVKQLLGPQTQASLEKAVGELKMQEG
ncbi:TlpA family protein disulfide reductase [Endozoicomonadaceae bacterium StTr2]